MARNVTCPVPGKEARELFWKHQRGEITLKEMQSELQRKLSVQTALPLQQDGEKEIKEH